MYDRIDGQTPSLNAFFCLSRRLLLITRKAGVPLIINDRVDVAMAIDAGPILHKSRFYPYIKRPRLTANNIALTYMMPSKQNLYLCINHSFILLVCDRWSTCRPVGHECR